MHGQLRTWGKVGAVVLCLALAFAAGWVVAQLQNVNKLPLNQVEANRWVEGIGMSVINARDTQFIDPAKLPDMIGEGLDLQSIIVAYLYDSMTPYQKKSFMLYIPAARKIAAAQQGQGTLRNRQHLMIFANCLQQLAAHGGSMRKCVEAQKGWKADTHDEH